MGIEGRKQNYSLCNYRLVQNVPNYSLAAHHSLQTKSLLLGGLKNKSFTADQIITLGGLKDKSLLLGGLKNKSFTADSRLTHSLQT